MMTNINKLTLVGAVVALVSACTILPAAPNLTVYQMPQHNLSQQATPMSNDVLKVARPYSRSYLDSNRVVVRTEEGNLAVLAGLRWDDLAPVVYRDSLIRALRSAGIYRAVVSDDASQGDFVLETDLHEFLVDYTKQPAEVVISVDTKLSNHKAETPLVSTASFAAKAPLPAGVSKDNAEAIFDAFGVANQQVQQQVAQWLLTQPLRP